MSRMYIVDGKIVKEERLLKVGSYSNKIRVCEIVNEEYLDLNTFQEAHRIQQERAEQLKFLLEAEEYKDEINFLRLYRELAPVGNCKTATLADFKEIGLDKKKFKKYIQKRKEYFIVDVTTDVEYYKAYVKICNAKLDFKHRVWNNSVGYRTVQGAVPELVRTNYNIAKDSVYPSRKKKMTNS